MQLPEHLGGHSNKTNLDHGAISWLIDYFKVKSFLDIGCGPGGMVELAQKYGLDSLGIDGDFTIERFDQSRFLIHDFSTGPAPLNKTFDLAWSCEFVEHVYDTYIPHYMPAFQSCKIVAMTYAPPGFGGYHHVNEQSEEYWIEVFSKYNFRHDSELTSMLRQSSSMNKKKKAFVKNRGMIFLNES